ncbi:MAG: hypothetical protein DI537_05340 [Stutzerimonas stutzeri]|nr:MAG: hypothetical protein DI537_05340 [Stutzerimonas stutzeri]
MHILNIAGDDSVAWIRDEISAAEAVAFASAGKVFGRFRLTSLLDPEPFDYVLGPFVHVGALTDAFGHYLNGVAALSGRFVIKARPGALPLPPLPRLPGYRDVHAAALHPVFAGEILLKVQECLDAGDGPMAAALRFEKDYAGDRFDDHDAAFYSRSLNIELGGLAPVAKPSRTAEFIQKLEAAAEGQDSTAQAELLIPPLTKEERVTAEAKLFELPVMSRRPSIRVQPVPAGASSARFSLGGDRSAGRPAARMPIDWSGLPVRVVEQRLTEEQSLLRADAVRRRRV